MTDRRTAPTPGAVLTRSAHIDEAASFDAERREVEFIASDETVDRYGDVISAAGWDLRAYERNPVVLFSHSYTQPVGTASVRVEGKQLLARVRLAAAGVSELADQLWRLIEARVLRAVSVGFTVASEDDVEAMRDASGALTGYKFLKQELLELSLVAVPANPNALAVARSLGVDPARVFQPSNRHDAGLNSEVTAMTENAALARIETPDDSPPRGLRRIVGSAPRPSEQLTPEIVRVFVQSGAPQTFARYGSLRDIGFARSIINQGGAAVPVEGGASAEVIAGSLRPGNLLLDIVPLEPRGPGKIHLSVITLSVNRAAIVPENTLKPQSDFGVAPKDLSFQKIAHWCSATDEELDDVIGLRAALDEELLIGLELKIDALIIFPAMTTPGSFTAWTPAADSTLIDNAVLAAATLQVRGESDVRVCVNPLDLANSLMVKDSTGQYVIHPPGTLQAITPCPSIPPGKLLAFAPRAVRAYERQSESVVIGLKNDDFTKNLKTILAEARVTAGVVLPASVLYGDAVGA